MKKQNRKLGYTTMITLAMSLFAVAAGSPQASAAPKGPAGKLYIDVHELGPGKVTAKDVAAAHQKDLAVQSKHGVQFERYWVDEAKGKVYCLSRAQSPDAIVATHREAHGLLPQKIFPVTDGEEAAMQDGSALFLDIHRLGPNKVDPAAVAKAHELDLSVEGRYGVNFVQYWVDESAGLVFCLSEAPDAEAVRSTHRDAHGLLPDEILKVTEGR